VICPKCQFINREEIKFCAECGNQLAQFKTAMTLRDSEHDREIRESGSEDTIRIPIPSEGERKHATVLFSDLAGYTALTGKLDPEEVKELMGLIFHEIARLAKVYDGTIERFFGDEVLMLFGIPKAHEDDTLRAIRVALEINKLIDRISARLSTKIERPLAMHTGINTGLVVTGDEYIEKARHGLTGEAVNLGTRLASLSKPGEILVGLETYKQSMHHFEFEFLGTRKIKGKTEPIQIYKLLSIREKHPTFHSSKAALADLIGREEELTVLDQAAQELTKGQGAIICVSGDAGTGKSRLTREFRERLDSRKIYWYEGHAQEYTQNTPYYPLIDLLTHTFEISDEDLPERIRKKIKYGLDSLLGADNRAADYICSLFSISDAEVEQVSPEFWKSRLRKSINQIISALARRGPTVICFEDLHWADPSFIELLISILKNKHHSILFVCVYRSFFQPFEFYSQQNMLPGYREIRLQDLSDSDAKTMLRSLLKSENLPIELMEFVENKAEGNPFYLEEVVNSLIESATLIRTNRTWKLTSSIDETNIPPSINSVLTARIDRLPKVVKRLMQEASVIGRTFSYEILRSVSQITDHIDGYLTELEQLDMIRVRALKPDREYVFKHALTREVVYNGILKSDRQAIHERIGISIETIYKERLSEFYETLAYHFSHSRNVRSAVDYLMKSGEKNIQRYALDESHKFYEHAYHILNEKSSKTDEEKRLLIELLIKWSFVYFWRADSGGLKSVLEYHRDLVDFLNDNKLQGMFYACLGFASGQAGKPKESYEYLYNALKLCQEAGNNKFIAYCYSWLAQACSGLGLLDDAINFGKKGQTIESQLVWDPLLFNETHTWLAVAHYYRGDCIKLKETANLIIEKGIETEDARLQSMGYMFMGMMFQAAGDFIKSIEEIENAMDLTKDPVVLYSTKMVLGMNYLLLGRLREAEDSLRELLSLTNHLTSWVRKSQSEVLLSGVLAASGNITDSVKKLDRLRSHFLENGHKFSFAFTEYILGSIHFQMIKKGAPKDIKVIARNFGFLLKTMPFAAKKAEQHFQEAIQVSKEVGAKGVLGQSCLDLGRLYKIRGKNDYARQHISDATKIFEECGAYVFLKNARDELASLI